MFILKTVVGKLWITIIGLVAVVMLTLSLFFISIYRDLVPQIAGSSR
ncbi:hypothetical protein LJK87_07410 [Paenibacillus sp. P25]|nr:hypothetical protein LJK87_07410 [Paenibacillus sp. P25]